MAEIVTVTWLHPSIRLGGRTRGQSVTISRADAEAYALKRWCTPPPTPLVVEVETLATDEEVPDVPPDSEE